MLFFFELGYNNEFISEMQITTAGKVTGPASIELLLVPNQCGAKLNL
jgi:hypothetical protein